MQIDFDFKHSWKVPGQNRGRCVDFHPTRNWIVIGRRNGSIELWGYEHHVLLHTFFHQLHAPQRRHSAVRCVAFHAFKNIVAAGNDNGSVEIFYYNYAIYDSNASLSDISHHITIDKQETIYRYLNRARALKFYPHQFIKNEIDYKTCLILSCGDDHVATIWDFQNKEQLAILDGHEHNVKCCQWCIIPISYQNKNKNKQHRTYVLTCSVDCSFRLWKIILATDDYKYGGDGNENDIRGNAQNNMLDIGIKLDYTMLFEFKNPSTRVRAQPRMNWIDIDWYYPFSYTTIYAISKKDNTRLDIIRLVTCDDSRNIRIGQIIIDENDNILSYSNQKIGDHRNKVTCAHFYHCNFNDKEYTFVFSVCQDRSLGIWGLKKSNGICLSNDDDVCTDKVIVCSTQSFPIFEFSSYGNLSRGWHIAINEHDNTIAISHDYGLTLHKINRVPSKQLLIVSGLYVYTCTLFFCVVHCKYVISNYACI